MSDNVHVITHAGRSRDLARSGQIIVRSGPIQSSGGLYGPPSPSDAEDFELREEELAATYLVQALEALNDTCDPRRMYPAGAFEPERTIAVEAMARYLGATARIDASRTSVLFSALACEAYANRYVAHARLSKRDREAIERLPTPDKLSIAPRLASGSTPFDAKSDPMQAIIELFRLRNMLVHPRARKVRVSSGTERAGHQDYNPATAARYVIAVASATLELDDLRGVRGTDITALAIWGRRDRLRLLGKRATEALPDLSDARPPGIAAMLREDGEVT